MENPNPVRPKAIGSSEVVASIDDLLTEILVRLPLKPLLRFKSVSKQWLSLISGSQFCLRRNPAPNGARGIFLCMKRELAYNYSYIPIHPPDTDRPFVNFEFTNSPTSVFILKSCNGLMLCCTVSQQWDSTLYDIGGHDCSFYVYNPTTQTHTAIPDVPTGFRIGAALAFDPVKCPRYKVVLVVLEEYVTKCAFRIKVYASGGGWTDCGKEGNRIGKVDVGKGVYCNGSIHWLSKEIFSQFIRGPSLRLNVDTLVLDEMPTPFVLHNQCNDSNYYFGESCGYLYFVEPMLHKFNVYEMKMDYSEWFVKNSVDLSPLVARYPKMTAESYNPPAHYVVYVLSVVMEEEDPKLVLRIPGKAIKLSLVDGTWEELCDTLNDNIHGWAVLRKNMYEYEYESTCFFGDEYGSAYVHSISSVN